MEGGFMDPNSTEKRTKTFAKVAATLLGALGLYVIGAMLLHIWRMLHSGDSIGQMLFIFVFAGIIFAIGGYCLFIAYRIRFDISVRIIRRVSLIAAVAFLVLLLYLTQVLKIVPPSLWEFPWVQLMTPVELIVGVGFYCLCKKRLISWLALPKEINSPRREKAVRTFFSWLSLFLFGAISSVLVHFTLEGQGHTDASGIPLGFWAVCGASALAAYLFYKIGVYIALRNRGVATD